MFIGKTPLATAAALVTFAIACSSNTSQTDRTASAPINTDDLNGSEQAGLPPKQLTGINITFATGAPDCLQTASDFDCGTAYPGTSGKLTRSNILDEGLRVIWHIPKELASASNCAEKIEGRTQFKCKFVRKVSSAAKVTLELIQAGRGSRKIESKEPVGGLNLNASSGGGAPGPDYSLLPPSNAASNYVMFLAGPIKGSVGFGGFDNACLKAIRDNPAYASEVNIVAARSIEFSMNSRFPTNPLALILTPRFDSSSGHMRTTAMGVGIIDFFDTAVTLVNSVSVTMDATTLDNSARIWTGHSFGASDDPLEHCSGWQSDTAFGTVGSANQIGPRRASYAGMIACSTEQYIYCLGW